MVLKYKNDIAQFKEEFEVFEDALETAKELYQKGYDFEIIDDEEYKIYSVNKRDNLLNGYKFIQVNF